MQNPLKINEKVIKSNNYLVVKEKEYKDNLWKVYNFLITWHNKKETIGTYILPITKDDKILYLEEFRYWPEKVVINFPVWMLDDWITEVDNCKKELLEETWYTSDEIIYLWESIIENYFEGKIRYYIAKNCIKKGRQDLEEEEKIKVKIVTKSEFEQMIINNKVLASKTCYCFLLAKLKNML